MSARVNVSLSYASKPDKEKKLFNPPLSFVGDKNSRSVLLTDCQQVNANKVFIRLCRVNCLRKLA